MKDADITSRSVWDSSSEYASAGGGRVCLSAKSNCIGVKRDWTAKVKHG